MVDKATTQFVGLSTAKRILQSLEGSSPTDVVTAKCTLALANLAYQFVKMWALYHGIAVVEDATTAPCSVSWNP